jgi:hypothetical protein
MYDNVIIIPYRQRESHLKSFINDVVPLFRKYLNPFKLVIVEQEDGKLFNRGRLLNIAFTEYKDTARFFITQDVDTFPLDECVKKMYGNNLYDVLRIFNGHDSSLGGICKLSRDSVFAINGFPNHIWGWGIEDRALYYRCKIMNVNMSTNMSNSKNFKFQPHKTNAVTYTDAKKAISHLEDEIFKCTDEERKRAHILSSGLNMMEYSIIERTAIAEDIELIKVSF